MRQKGFATIFGLCLVLIVALIVKGIQEAETNHAHEVLNFEMEQALQNAAESGIVVAAEYVSENPNYLPFSDGWVNSKKNIPIDGDKTFYHGEQEIKIIVKVWGERGNIYLCPASKNKVSRSDAHDGVYFMSRASMESNFFGKNIYRRAYAYVLDTDKNKMHFMELPTENGNYVTKSK